MNFVNSKGIIVQETDRTITFNLVEGTNDILVFTFQVQFSDWKQSLLNTIETIDNKCILVFQSFFIIELWLKLNLIKKLVLLDYEQKIENSDIRLNGDNDFELSKVGHRIEQTLKALIKAGSFKDERYLLTLILEQCKIIGQEAEVQELDKYEHLKYNHNGKIQLLANNKANNQLKNEIRKLIDYAI